MTIAKFLDYLVGVDSERINRLECWQDRIKYRAIALSMGCTCILSFISGTFAIASFTPSLIIAVPLGVLWAATITGIDRYVIISSDSYSSTAQRVRALVARGIVGICTSIVVSEPTTLYIFREEIQAEIAVMQDERIRGYESEIAQSGRLQELTQDEERLKREIERLESVRGRQLGAALAEAEGSAGSGLAGKGTLYREKSQEVDRTTSLIDEKQSALLGLEAAINAERAEQQRQVSTLEELTPDSLLTQIHALNRLKSQDSVINGAATFIALFLLVLDFAPVLAKLSARPGVYDSMVDSEETTAIRHFQLASQLETKKQDVDFEAHKRNIEGVRTAYYQTVHDTTISVFEIATTSEEFKETQREIASYALEMFRFHMEALVSDAIKAPVERVTSLVNSVQDEMLRDIPFRVRSQVAQNGIDHANATVSKVSQSQPPSPLPDQESASSLFGNHFDDDDDTEDFWTTNGSAPTTTTHI